MYCHVTGKLTGKTKRALVTTSTQLTYLDSLMVNRLKMALVKIGCDKSKAFKLKY